MAGELCDQNTVDITMAIWDFEALNSGSLAVLYSSSKRSHHATHHTLPAEAAVVVSRTDSPVQLLCLIQPTALTMCGSPSVTPFVHEEGEGHCTAGYSVEVLYCCGSSVGCLAGPVHGIANFYSSVLYTLTHLCWKWGPNVSLNSCTSNMWRYMSRWPESLSTTEHHSVIAATGRQACSLQGSILVWCCRNCCVSWSSVLTHDISKVIF